jgi:hypothetical protein
MALLVVDGQWSLAHLAALDVRHAGKVFDLIEATNPGVWIIGVLIAASEQRWRTCGGRPEHLAAGSMNVLPIQIPVARIDRQSESAPRRGVDIRAALRCRS